MDNETVDDITGMRIKNISPAALMRQTAEVFYRVCKAGDFTEKTPTEQESYEYIFAYSKSMADVLSAAEAETFPTSIRDRACSVDFLRGLVQLSYRHPNKDAREMYETVSRAVGSVLNTMVNAEVGFAVTNCSAPETRQTLFVWHGIVSGAGDLLHKKSKAKQHIVLLNGRSASERDIMLEKILMWAPLDMFVLIGSIGLIDGE